MKHSNERNSINRDTSVIICTKNCEDSIEKVIISVMKNNPLEIIVVDAKSTDRTRDIAKKYATKILTDPGKGLAVARNIGLRDAKGEYIFFLGPDNVIGSKSLEKLKKYLLKHKYVGTAALTRVKNRNLNYFTRGLDLRWQLRFFEGQREVIGTPYIFKSEILNKYQFDPKMSWSDDSDLAVNLARDGYKVGYSNVLCWEIGFEDIKSILYRFRMYGKSDYEYYHKYSSQWKLKRRIKSLLHPLQAEFIEPLKKLKSIKFFYYLPFFFLITLYRYRGYVGFAIRKGSEKK
jgi:glycosyltransferase involved in cell wall biosynthesis